MLYGYQQGDMKKMGTIKKLIATLLVVCMFLRLPESKAMAAKAGEDSRTATASIEYSINDSKQANCTEIYSIFSNFYTFKINIVDSNGDSSLGMYGTDSGDHTLFNDEDRVLPWEHEPEQPQAGFMIPILHF